MTDKVALVTGANKGIGYETARQLGAQGFTVLVGARDEGRGRTAVDSLTAAGIDARLIQLDVTDDESVRRAAATIEQDFGRLDVLVNNAGIPSLRGGRVMPSETPLDELRAVYEVNVFGLVRVTNAMLPLLRKAPAGRIVNVSSEVGSVAATADPASPFARMPASALYPSTKSAVNMLTVQYAKELRDTPIKVNAANPGFVNTDFTAHHGILPVEVGAGPSVYLATLPDDGPSGIFYGHRWTTPGDSGLGQLPW